MASKVLVGIKSTNDATLSRGREVIQIEADALHLLARSLDDSFVNACQVILRTRHRVVVTGMGKSGHIARKVAATLSATGTPAIYIHPAEAAHGDLGMLVRGDTLLVISNSGKTSELRPILVHSKELGLPIIGIASRRSSLVMEYAEFRLVLPNTREACAANIAPTTSTTMQLALGDALAMAVMDLRGVTSESLRSLHPGGAIGLQLSLLRDIMHGVEQMPLVTADASMPDAILTMTSGGFGIAGVINDSGALIGVITDGDLRRNFSRLESVRAIDIMTSNPKTLEADLLAQDALQRLNETKITAAFVMEKQHAVTSGRPIGIVHVHDFLRFGLS